MGFLNKLWDETLAGPAPESGLGKLRKSNSVSAVRSVPNRPFSLASRSFHQQRNHNDRRDVDDNDVQISRSITILRTRSNDPGSGPSSPAFSSGSSSPVTPGTPRDSDVKRFTRKKQPFDATEPSNSSAYDWIMITALDR